MKKVMVFFLFVLSVAILKAQTTATPYDFPVKPGTEEWKKLSSRSEMANVLQIPSTTLKTLNTAALVQTCLNFPMFKDLYFFNNIQTGLDGLKQSFNGFQELLSRNDVGIELFALYKQMNPGSYNKMWNDTIMGDFTFRFVQIEMLLSQNEVLSKFSEETKNSLVKEASKKYKLKEATNKFSIFSSSPSMLIAGRILDEKKLLNNMKSNVGLESIQKFISTGTAENLDILETIWSLFQN